MVDFIDPLANIQNNERILDEEWIKMVKIDTKF